MVCLGNICRSPLAEGILKSKLNPDFYIVDSAGTSAYHIGEVPDHRSIAIAKKMGLIFQIKEHVSLLQMILMSLI